MVLFQQTKTAPDGNNEISEIKGTVVINISKADEIIFKNEDIHFLDANGSYIHSYKEFYDLSKLKKYLRNDNTFKLDQHGDTLFVEFATVENKKAVKLEKQYFEIEKDGSFEFINLPDGKYYIDNNAGKPRLLKSDVGYSESVVGDHVMINEGYTKIPLERYRRENYNIIEIIIKRTNRDKQGVSTTNRLVVSKYLFDPKNQSSSTEYDRIKAIVINN
ncbi:MAG: hypothetical protein IPQ05_18215 [Leptospiraceae bacterium]|nr:hypothetical protein [Leptospiraceae bacterium]